jgi:hypothetical protein
MGGCTEPGDAIALVRVVDLKVSALGTRSEHVVLTLAVEQVLSGTLPPTVETWGGFGAGPALEKGRVYVLCLPKAQGYAPYGVGDFVEVESGQEQVAVEAHRHALAALRAAPPVSDD